MKKQTKYRKHINERNINQRAVVERFRKRLSDEGRSLTWWRRTYIPDLYTYNYFIRQMNNPESLKDDLLEALRDYLIISG